jgi:hypothetical protein
VVPESLGVGLICLGLVVAQQGGMVMVALDQSGSLQVDRLEPYQELVVAAGRL